MREKHVEQTLAREVKKRGGLALKLISPGLAGMPDRLVILPGGQILFIELKAPGKTPRPLQHHRHAQLRQLGCTVHTIDHPDHIPEVLP